MKRPVAKYKCERCGHEEHRMSARSVDETAPGECPRCGGDLRVVARDKRPTELSKIEELVSKRFDIIDFSFGRGRGEFLVEARDPKKSFSKVLGDLRKRGYLAAMREQDGELGLAVIKAPVVEKSNPMINVILILATLGTTFLAGYLLRNNFLDAALFSSALMVILGAHELGHKITTWRHGVAATLPYFIPAPTLIGTFGAVIKVKSPIPTKEALVEMGASGPLLGFAFAIPITLVGLSLSEPTGGFALPMPILFALMGFGTFGHFPGALNPHPLAFAGWIGMLVTWLNLIPAGQLDGGHVARGLLSRKRHYQLTRAIGFSLVLLGFLMPLFLLWGILILIIFGTPHGGALNDVSKLSRRQKTLAVAALIVFVLCLPIPLY
jgi:Zn-dependent protease/DNA-directed RNA polymerase subunit RPC12/RpoP